MSPKQFQRILRSLAILMVSATALPTLVGCNPGEPVTRFKVRVAEPGVYRLSFEELAEAGADPGGPSERIGLYSSGDPVPLWLDDGGDGQFDRGDSLVFVGDRLAGEHSYYSEFSRFNVYQLDLQADDPSRMQDPGLVQTASCEQPAALSSHRRLEHDRLRLRFSNFKDATEETWYWAKLSHIDAEPFAVDLELKDLDEQSERQARLSLGLQGWSKMPWRLRGKVVDHRLELLVGDDTVASLEWNTPDGPQRLDVEVSAQQLASANGRVALRVPKRHLEGEPHALIDVVMLNWVEIDYPRKSRLHDTEDLVVVEASQGIVCLELDGSGFQQVALYDAAGARFAATDQAGLSPLALQSPDSNASFTGQVRVVTNQNYATVDDVLPDHPSHLKNRDQQADYLMIAHPRLAKATERLARFHRSRGLSVAVAQIDDVYDEFSHGVVDPKAIRDFVAHAYHHWQAPQPRFVLLVGDASWDGRNTEAIDRNYADKTFRPHTRLPKNKSTPYENNAELNVRNMIPTWSTGTTEGQAANDNWFVMVDGDDELPDLAIGRFPVVASEEVDAIVDKTIRYVEERGAADWRKRVLWITNQETAFQRTSETLAEHVEGLGFESHRVYPLPDEPSNEHHRQTLLDAFNDGQLLVHFFGHGGRYIWRTGPPDLEKNHDLFRLEDLDELEPGHPLAVVLSMTCYTAPFDHPSSDSIGEKFLRVPERGAVAVLGAAWRNTPSIHVSKLLVEELTQPGTIGEAILRAKRKSLHGEFINQYNLLGDPAAPIALPPQQAARLSSTSSASRGTMGAGPQPTEATP